MKFIKAITSQHDYSELSCEFGYIDDCNETREKYNN